MGQATPTAQDDEQRRTLLRLLLCERFGHTPDRGGRCKRCGVSACDKPD